MGWTSYHAHNEFSCKGVQHACLQLPLNEPPDGELPMFHHPCPRLWRVASCTATA